MRRWRRRALGVIGILWLALGAFGTGGTALAQDVFKGRSISLYAGFTPGGGVDGEMRLVAQYLGAHIPGHPNVQPMNMPGAGGILLGNHLYSIAKPDGLTLGMPGRSGFFLAALVGDSSARYELPKFTWIGSGGPTNLVFWVRKGLGVRTWEEVRKAKTPVVVGGLATSSASVVVPRVLERYEHVPLRIISGYTGLSEATLAMERGEVDMIYTAAGTFRPDMIKSGAIIPLMQTFPIEPDLPSLQEIRNPRARTLLGLLTAPSRIGAPLLAPPNVPPETTAILRAAYLAMSRSKDYVADAARRGMDIVAPTSGADLQSYVATDLNNIPPDIVTEFKGYVGMK
jgi:tripartite-type tricarboxylate transporter receptor subunit TctC